MYLLHASRYFVPNKTMFQVNCLPAWNVKLYFSWNLQIYHKTCPLKSQVLLFVCSALLLYSQKSILKNSFWKKSAPKIIKKWEQDSSPTRQFTDTVIEDSSPTDLKTVHWHFWRQFIDTFLSRYWQLPRKYNWLLWRNIDELWFEVICWYNLLRKRYFVGLIND